MTFGTNLASIGIDAFQGCSGLATITISASVTNIGDGAFLYCSSLAAITVDPLNPLFSGRGGVLFDKSQTTLLQFPGGISGSYLIPTTVTNIGFNSFNGCMDLTSVSLGTNVTTIGALAFADCMTLAAITVDPGNLFYSSLGRGFVQ